MRRQRNMSRMKEMEESKLLDIEFKTSVIRLLKNLLETTKKLSETSEELSETFKDLNENTKKMKKDQNPSPDPLKVSESKEEENANYLNESSGEDTWKNTVLLERGLRFSHCFLCVSKLEPIPEWPPLASCGVPPFQKLLSSPSRLSRDHATLNGALQFATKHRSGPLGSVGRQKGGSGPERKGCSGQSEGGASSQENEGPFCTNLHSCIGPLRSAGPDLSAQSVVVSGGCRPNCPWRLFHLPLLLRGNQGSSSRCLHLLTVPALLLPAAGTSPNCSTPSAGASRAGTISAWEQWQREQGFRQIGDRGVLEGGA
ncbi:hypothetical protein QTO34_001383, partial [Cnephaeus nilssonii]